MPPEVPHTHFAVCAQRTYDTFRLNNGEVLTTPPDTASRIFVRNNAALVNNPEGVLFVPADICTEEYAAALNGFSREIINAVEPGIFYSLGKAGLRFAALARLLD